MTTLPLRVPHIAAPVPAFGRFFAGLALILDTFVEAQQLASEAHKRYPFAAW
jgi:hypothetical protein